MEVDVHQARKALLFNISEMSIGQLIPLLDIVYGKDRRHTTTVNSKEETAVLPEWVASMVLDDAYEN